MSAFTAELRAMVRDPRNYLNAEPWAPIMALFLLNAVDEFDNAAYDNLGPEIASSFHLSSGAFNSIAIIATILAPIAAVPVAWIGDRWKRMPLAIVAAVVWGTASLLTGIATMVWMLVVVRLISGCGKGVNDPVHGALIADFYSPAARAKAFGLRFLAPAIGGVIAAPIVGLLGDRYGWRVPFFVATAPTLLVLPLVLRVREPARDRFEAIEQVEPRPWRESVSRLWAIRTLRLSWIGGAFAFGALTGASREIPFLLDERYGISAFGRGVITAVGGVLAAFSAVWGTAFIQRHLNVSPKEGLRRLCYSGVIASVAIFVIAISPGAWLSIGMVWVVLVCFGFVAPGLGAINTLVAPPEIRSTAFALGGLISLAGAGFALLGVVVGSIDPRLTFAFMAPVFLRGVFYFFQAAQHLDNDIARLDPEVRARAGAGDAQSADAERVLLELKDVTVHYGSLQVLFGVDLVVREGEIVALLGTNGAGKSTTLNAISGLHPASAGNVWLRGEAITGETPERTVPRGIVQVPGGRGVFPGLSVEDNLGLGAFTFRTKRSLVRERTAQVYELFPRLAERRSQLAGSLSGGERQMLTLAQSFLLEPSLLMIDELSLGLAPAIVGELLEAVRAINRTGTAILVVEQSVNVALTLADRAYFMEKGEVRFSGPTRELLGRDDLLRSVFLEGAKV